MSIFANFRRVTRYGVAVFLPAFACFSALADQQQSGVFVPLGDCSWEWNGTNGFNVTCTLSGSGFIPVEGGNVGSCTNCSAMSPAECEQVRAQISSYLHDIDDYSSRLQGKLDDADRDVSYLIESLGKLKLEGDSFTTIPGVKQILPNYGNVSAKNKEANVILDQQPQADYYIPFLNSSGNVVSDEASGSMYGRGYALNSLYTYYNDSVKPVLETSLTSLVSVQSSIFWAEEDLRSINSNVDNIRPVLTGMNCSACQGSGGGDGGGSSQPSGGCPCSEAIYAVRDAVNNCYTRLTEIKEKLDEWDEKITKFEQDVEKFKGWISVIAEAVAPMGTNFIAAVNYKTLDGVSFAMKTLDKALNENPNGFDFGEYGNLSWYSRVEYLLLKIAGVYSQTNREDNLTADAINDQYSDIADREETLSSSVDGVGSKFDQVHSSFRNFFSSFKSGIGTGSSNGHVYLFSNWIGDSALEIDVDSSLVSLCRACTSLVWSVGFACLLYEILLYYWKFFASAVWFWVRGTTAFVK